MNKRKISEIIPESDEEEETSQDSISKKTDTSSISGNFYTLAHQRSPRQRNHSDEECIPQDILDYANEAESMLIPQKSKEVYDRTHNKFKAYLNKNKMKKINETILLGYFNMLNRNQNSAPGTLWAIYSMLKKTLYIYDSINIESFSKLKMFLSLNQKNSEHIKKKANTFTEVQITQFLQSADDNNWLAHKVALILSINGLCRRCELYKLTIDNIVDHNTCINVILTKTKNGEDREFSLSGYFCNILKKYLSLRPSGFERRNLFIKYEKGRCQRQVIGIHKIGSFPKEIASFLKLSNPELYTGHSFRRTGATVAANAGLDFISLKKVGGWKSSAVAESYIDQSLAQKTKISTQITQNIIKQMVPSSTIISTESTPPIIPQIVPKTHSIVENVIDAKESPSVDQLRNFSLEQSSKQQVHLVFNNYSGFTVFGSRDQENH